MSEKQQCWEYKQCGREEGGANVKHLGVCPAYTDTEIDGLNSGENGGRMCWVSAGTFCGGQVQGTFAAKAIACLDCDFFHQVHKEQGDKFAFLYPGREFEEVSGLINELREVQLKQQNTIRELATPVMQIWDDIIVAPIIGTLDKQRCTELTEALLHAVSEFGSQFIILDITGVNIVDTQTADHIIRAVHACQLLGAQAVISGIRPAVSQTLVELGVDLGDILTRRNLRAALEHCLAAKSQIFDLTKV